MISNFTCQTRNGNKSISSRDGEKTCSLEARLKALAGPKALDGVVPPLGVLLDPELQLQSKNDKKQRIEDENFTNYNPLCNITHLPAKIHEPWPESVSI